MVKLRKLFKKGLRREGLATENGEDSTANQVDNKASTGAGELALDSVEV